MLYKKRTKSPTLQKMEILDRRMNFPNKNKKYLYHLQGGFTGELALDKPTSQLGDEFLVLNDLSLRSELANSFQIDSLILSRNRIRFYEAKNYSGDYSYGEELYFKEPNFEISNPLIQLQTTKNKLKILTKELNCDFSVQGYVAFVHPEFTLFNMPKDNKLLMPSQLNRHFSQMQSQTTNLTQAERHFATQLLDNHTEQPLFENDIPAYSYATLKKGIYCKTCGSFNLSKNQKSYTCHLCSYKGSLHSALATNIMEYRLLFPNDKLKSSVLYDWCGGFISMKSIQRELNADFYK